MLISRCGIACKEFTLEVKLLLFVFALKGGMIVFTLVFSPMMELTLLLLMMHFPPVSAFFGKCWTLLTDILDV